MTKSLEVGLLSYKLLLELCLLRLKLGTMLLHGLGYLSQLVSLLLALVILLEDFTDFCLGSRPLLNRLINLDIGSIKSE